MTNAKSSARRPAVKQNQIIAELRRQVVDGLLPPGSRLPTRRELEDQFKASIQTVQKALDHLIRDGFVLTRGSLGTFVTENPPHLTHYGVVFPNYPGEGFFPRGWTAIVNEALAMERAEPRKLPIYYGIDGHSDTEDYQRLVRDVQSHRLAGLIFASKPYQLAGTPLLDEPGVPRVAIMSADDAGLPAITQDRASFRERALDYVVSMGRRRLAVLGPNEIATDPFVQAAAERSLELRPFWIQLVSHYNPSFARNCVHLLMHEGPQIRPDALVITDDNLVEYGTAGLVAAGVRVPEDLVVVAHCNFPWPAHSVLPVKRLGFDARQVLQRCVESIDRQRRGERVDGVVKVPAVFEDELN